MNQTRYLDLIWRSEGDEATFLNTWEWVEIAVKVAAIDDILVIPGTISQQRQTESHTDPHPRHPQVNDLTLDIVKRTTVYASRARSKTAIENYLPATHKNQMPSTRFTRKPAEVIKVMHCKR